MKEKIPKSEIHRNTGAVRQRLPPQEKPALKTQYGV